MFERIILKRLVLYNHQYGFRKGLSTDLALVAVIDDILNKLEKKDDVVGIYMDLSKAFDTLDHTVLLCKLQFYGLRGPVYEWIKNYLCDRKQIVKYNGIMSKPQYVTCGVPQGSIMGPILFLLYINDIHRISTKISFVLFADDSNVFLSGPDINRNIQVLNKELEILNLWFKSNFMSLNLKKTHYMIFTRKNVVLKQNVIIDGVNIDRVRCTSFLGVIIDEKLTWKDHIDYLKNKISKSIGVLYRLRHAFTRTWMLLLYKTLVLPYLNYCNIIWGAALSSVLTTLKILQKKALKVVLQLPQRSSSEYVFSLSKSLTIEGIHQVHIGIFMFKFANKLLPKCFWNKFVLNSELHTYSTRGASHYCCPKVRTAKYKTSLHYRGPLVWNYLPSDLKIISTLECFKTFIKRHVLHSQF